MIVIGPAIHFREKDCYKVFKDCAHIAEQISLMDIIYVPFSSTLTKRSSSDFCKSQELLFWSVRTYLYISGSACLRLQALLTCKINSYIANFVHPVSS